MQWLSPFGRGTRRWLFVLLILIPTLLPQPMVLAAPSGQAPIATPHPAPSGPGRSGSPRTAPGAGAASSTSAEVRLGPGDPRPPVGTPEPRKPFALPTESPRGGGGAPPAATPSPLPALPAMKGVAGARQLPVRPRAVPAFEEGRVGASGPAYGVSTRGVVVDFFDPERTTAGVKIQKPRQGVVLGFELPGQADLRTAKGATVVARPANCSSPRRRAG